MTRLSVLLILFFAVLHSSLSLNAQISGRWLRGEKNNGFPVDLEAGLSAVDKFGNVFIAGEILSGDTSRFGPVTLTTNLSFFAAKLDSSGNYKWVIPTSTVAWPVAMVTDDSGNLYVSGFYFSTSCTIGAIVLSNPMAYHMGFLAKISPIGIVIWAKNIAYDNIHYFSGELAIDDTGRIYMAGIFDEPTINIGGTVLTNTDPSGNYSDIFITKLSSSGTFLWAKSFGSSKDDYSAGFTVTGKGNIYISGLYSSDSIVIGSTLLYKDSVYTKHQFIAKFNSSGNSLWAKNSRCFVNAITTDGSENLYVAGSIDQSMILGPDTLTVPGSSYVYMYFAKYAPAGNIMWARNPASDSFAQATAIASDQSGNLWICGSIGNVNYGVSTCTFNFNGHIVGIPFPGGIDPLIIARYDTCGNYLESTWLPSGGDDAVSIVTDNEDNFYITGDYLGTRMIVGADTLDSLSSSPVIEEDLFVAKYRYTYDSNSCSPNISSAATPNILGNSMDIELYPNPTAGKCTIYSKTQFQPGSKAELYNPFGSLVKTYTLSGPGTTFSTSDLVPGMYLIRVITEGNIFLKKIIVLK